MNYFIPIFNKVILVWFILISFTGLFKVNAKTENPTFVKLNSLDFPAASNSLMGSASYSIVEKDNKKGLVDDKGTMVIPAKYDDLGWSQGAPKVINNVIGYKENNAWGLITIKNSKITAPLYSRVLPFNEDMFITAKRTSHVNQISYGVINIKGKVVIPFNFFSLQGTEGNLIAGIEKDGLIRFGMLDIKNNVLVPFDYTAIRPITHNRYALKNSQQKEAMVDSKGFKIIGFELDSIADFSGNTANVYVNGKQGIIDQNGNYVLKPVYKNIVEENYGYRGIHYPEWKLIDAKNNLISKFEYDEIIPADKNIYKVKIGSKMALIDAKDNFLLPIVTAIGGFENKIAVFNKQNKFGVINHQGAIIVKAEYDSVFITDVFIVARKASIQEKWFVFNHEGDSLTERTYQDVKNETTGLMGVKRNDSWGFINETGNEIIPNQYDSVENFQGKVAKASFLGSEGVINNNGQWLANPWHEFIQPVSEDVFYFRSGKNSGLIGPDNKYIFKTENIFFPINSGFIEKNPENKLGLLNAKGKIILKTEYDEISHLQGDSIYIFKKGKSYGIITKSGNIKVGLNNRFQELHPLKDNYLGVKINNKYGFVDINGNLRISNQYDAIGHYQENLAPIKLRGNWGYIDKIERIVVQPAFDHAYNFNDGLAIVMKNNKYGLVNKEGKLVLPVEYDRLEKTHGKRYLCYLNDKVGLTSERGRLMIFPKFDAIEELENGYVIIKRQNKYGLLTNSGVDTIPMIYDKLTYDHFNDLYLCGNAAESESVTTKK